MCRGSRSTMSTPARTISTNSPRACRGGSKRALDMSTPVRAPAAKVTDVDKRFGGAHALRGVSLTFETGNVHAVAGENGAGKSTLMKILSGVIGDFDGTLEIEGVARRFANIRDAERHGVFLVPQELNIK